MMIAHTADAMRGIHVAVLTHHLCLADSIIAVLYVPASRYAHTIPVVIHHSASDCMSINDGAITKLTYSHRMLRYPDISLLDGVLECIVLCTYAPINPTNTGIICNVDCVLIDRMLQDHTMMMPRG